jgi:hypothetical protein
LHDYWHFCRTINNLGHEIIHIHINWRGVGSGHNKLFHFCPKPSLKDDEPIVIHLQAGAF